MLIQEPVPEGVTKLFKERTQGMLHASVLKFGIGSLDNAVFAYGLSCYLQGVHDAAEAMTKDT
jgi:hypothetical protein